MIKSSERWAIELTGEDSDKATWSLWLTRPFDPFVEEIKDERGDYLVLRSTEFDLKESVDQVRLAAKELLRTLNVAMSTNADTDPLGLGAVVEFIKDAPPRKHVFIELAPLTIRMRPGRFEVRIEDAHGNVIQSPPTQSKAQRWMRATQLNPDLGHALRYLEGKPDWVALYKAFEVIRDMPNGGISRSEIGRFTQSANVGPRHHIGTLTAHKRPMELWEARTTD